MSTVSSLELCDGKGRLSVSGTSVLRRCVRVSVRAFLSVCGPDTVLREKEDHNTEKKGQVVPLLRPPTVSESLLTTDRSCECFDTL